jgi:branched-chain amino acid transport system substrate-binding protein
MICGLLSIPAVAPAAAEPKYGPGASDTEIKLGQTIPYSGPVSAWSVIGKTHEAYFRKLNESGGVNGRKISLISLDDAYSPPKTVEQTRKLVESEEVLAVFGSIGTATNSAIQKYLNSKKVPQLFVITGATKWGDPDRFPWTIGWTPPYKIEAEIYADYVKTLKEPRVGILFQNDDYGKDYVKHFRDRLGPSADAIIVKEASYEVTDPTIDSRLATLKASGADVLLDITTPRFSALAIRGVSAMGWKPVHILNLAGTSVQGVLQPAGLEQSNGLISTTFIKDPSDPAWADDLEVKTFKSFFESNFAKETADIATVAQAYAIAATMEQVLRQCGDDLSRENVMAQTANLKNYHAPLLLPGISINTSPKDYYPLKQMQMMRFDGHSWVRFGEVISP